MRGIAVMLLGIWGLLINVSELDLLIKIYSGVFIAGGIIITMCGENGRNKKK